VLFRSLGARIVLCFRHLVALSYSGTFTEAFPFIPSGYEMASKIVAWG